MKKINVNNLLASAKDLLDGAYDQSNADVVEALSTQSLANTMLAIAVMKYQEMHPHEEN